MSTNESLIKRLLAEELTDSSPEFKTEIARLAASEMNHIGCAFFEGKNGTRQTYYRARAWFKRARIKGSSNACYNLGIMYKNGEGVEASIVKAAKYFEEAVAKEDKDASTVLENIIKNPKTTSFDLQDLANFYYQPGPKCNYKLACKYYELIVERGRKGYYADWNRAARILFTSLEENVIKDRISLAIYRTGLMYISSKHPNHDFNKGIKQLHHAAQRGYAEAQKSLNFLKPDNTTDGTRSYMMGSAYYQKRGNNTYFGVPVQKNISLARLWFEDASRQGQGVADYELGEMHEQGINIPKNPAIAAQYYQKAKNMGHIGANLSLQSLITRGLVSQDKLNIDPTPAYSAPAEENVMDKFILAAANNLNAIKKLLNERPDLLDAECPESDDQLLYNSLISVSKTVGWTGAVASAMLVVPPATIAALPFAAWKSYKALRESDRNTRDRRGWTMLDYAGESGATDVAEELIHRGAKTSKRFIDLAIGNEHKKFVERSLVAIERMEKTVAGIVAGKNARITAEKERDYFKLKFINAINSLAKITLELSIVFQNFDKVTDVLIKFFGEEKVKQLLQSQPYVDPVANINPATIDNIKGKLEEMGESLAFVKQMCNSNCEESKKLANSLYNQIKPEYDLILQKCIAFEMSQSMLSIAGVTATSLPVKPPATTEKQATTEPQQFPLYDEENIKNCLNAAVLKAPFDGFRNDTFRVHEQQDNGKYKLFLLLPQDSLSPDYQKHFTKDPDVEGIDVGSWDFTLTINKHLMDDIAPSEFAPIIAKALKIDTREGFVALFEIQENKKCTRLSDLLTKYADWSDIKTELKRIDEEQRGKDLVDELYPCLASSSNVETKILFPYNRSANHWLTGELLLSKQTSEDGQISYQLIAYAHDPYGKGMLEENIASKVHLALLDRLREESGGLITAIELIRRESPYKPRQRPEDGNSCGVIVTDDTMKRLQNKSLDVENPYDYGAPSLRAQQAQMTKEYNELPFSACSEPKPPTVPETHKSPGVNASPKPGFFQPKPATQTYAFGLVERNYFTNKIPADDVLDAILPQSQFAKYFWRHKQTARSLISEELLVNREKYQDSFADLIEEYLKQDKPIPFKDYEDYCQLVEKEGTRLGCMEIEAFSEVFELPCFLVTGDGGIYMGKQYRRADNPPALLGINNFDQFRALELPPGEDEAYLESILNSQEVDVIDYGDIAESETCSL